MPAGWVSAGAAALGAVQGIEAGNAAKAASKANAAEAAVVNEAKNTALSDAESVASQPYQAYTGSYAAPMSGNQQQAYTLASNEANSGQAQTDNSKATSLIDQVANGNWNSQTAQQYMNPYTLAVTDAATKAQQQSYLQSLGQLKASEAQSGAFGGSSSALAQSNLAAQNAMAKGQLTAQNNANAYDTAFKNWSSDQTMKLNAAKSYEEAGQDITQMTGQQVQQLLQTGGVSQAIAQTNLNGQYQEFLRQQNWSSNQLKDLLSATSGGTQQVSAGQQSSTANSLLGLGSTLAGLYGSGFGSSGSSDNYGLGSSSSLTASAGAAGDYTANALSSYAGS